MMTVEMTAGTIELLMTTKAIDMYSLRLLTMMLFNPFWLTPVSIVVKCYYYSQDQ